MDGAPRGLVRLTLTIMALAFAVVATLGWFAPDVLFDPIGMELTEPAAYAEVRAAYGGLFGASALLFAAGARRSALTGYALAWGALVLGGFVFGRLYSLVVDGVPAGPAWGALGAESVGLVACLICLRSRRTRR